MTAIIIFEVILLNSIFFSGNKFYILNIYYVLFIGSSYTFTNYEFLVISKYILVTLKYYSDSNLNYSVNTLLFIHSYISNLIIGSISEQDIVDIAGLIYILDIKSLLLHLILELNYPLIKKLLFLNVTLIIIFLEKFTNSIQFY